MLREKLIRTNRFTYHELEELITRALRRKTFQFTTGSNFQSLLRDLAKAYCIDTKTSYGLVPL